MESVIGIATYFLTPVFVVFGLRVACLRWLVAIAAAAPTACDALEKISIPCDEEKPHRKDPKVKRRTPYLNTFVFPVISPSFPNTRITVQIVMR